MRKSRAINALAAFVLLFFPSLHAAEPESKPSLFRTCQEKDLLGGFALVEFREAPKGEDSKNHALFPYEYIVFYPKHLYGFGASNRPEKTPAELEHHMARGGAWKNSYILGQDGVLDLYRNGDIRYKYRCVVSIRTDGHYRSGDIIFAGYTKHHESETYKLYRRWF